MREDDDCGAQVRLNLRHRLVGPGEQELVGTGNPLGRGKARSGVGDHRPPTEELGRAAKSLCRVDRSVDEQPWRRPEDVGEQAPSVELDHLAVTGTDQLPGRSVVPVAEQSLRAVVERVGHRNRFGRFYSARTLAQRILDPAAARGFLVDIYHLPALDVGSEDPISRAQ